MPDSSPTAPMLAGEHKPIAAQNQDGYYHRHVFFCVNQRESGARCCADHPAEQCRAYAKRRLKQLAQHGRGLIRINRSGCLDRCAQGPVLVVYPEAVWYSYADNKDMDEIIERHLLNGDIVDRLRI